MSLIRCEAMLDGSDEKCDSSQFQFWTDGHVQCVFCASPIDVVSLTVVKE